MAKTVGILLRNREQDAEAETTADPPGKAGVASVTLQRWDGSTVVRTEIQVLFHSQIFRFFLGKDSNVFVTV